MPVMTIWNVFITARKASAAEPLENSSAYVNKKKKRPLLPLRPPREEQARSFPHQKISAWSTMTSQQYTHDSLCNRLRNLFAELIFDPHTVGLLEAKSRGPCQSAVMHVARLPLQC